MSVKKIGLLFGMEDTFPWALIKAINQPELLERFGREKVLVVASSPEQLLERVGAQAGQQHGHRIDSGPTLGRWPSRHGPGRDDVLCCDHRCRSDGALVDRDQLS